MTDIFSGDPRLFLSENGSRFIFRGGQPVMDRGLENLALISLFTGRDWVGNTLFSDIDQQIGSDFEEAAKQPITLSMFNDVAQAAERALDNPAFGNVIVTVGNPSGDRLDVIILIEPPGQDSRVLILSRNGDNWIAQKIEPAEGRR